MGNMNVSQRELPHYEDALRLKSNGRLYFGDIADSPMSVDTEVGDWLAFFRRDGRGVSGMTVVSSDFYASMDRCNSVLAELERWDKFITGPEDVRYARDLHRRSMEVQGDMERYEVDNETYDMRTGILHVSESPTLDARDLALGPRDGFLKNGSVVGGFVSAMAGRGILKMTQFTDGLTGETVGMEFTVN